MEAVGEINEDAPWRLQVEKKGGLYGGRRWRKEGRGSMEANCESDGDAPWRLKWRREGGDSIEAEHRKRMKWKKVDIEPRLETGESRR